MRNALVGSDVHVPVSQLIHPEYATIDGLSIRFAEGGKAGRDAILLSPVAGKCVCIRAGVGAAGRDCAS